MSLEPIVTDLGRARDRSDELIRLNDATWPEFLLHGDVRCWSSLYREFADFQILCLYDGALVGAGLTVPFAWEPGASTPGSIDEITYHASWPLPGGKGVLCALAALVAPEHRRQGLSRRIVRAMCDLAARNRLEGVLAPVRPTRKHEFPFEAMEDYAIRRDESGRVWDPWLRVHEELGGRQLGLAPRAVTVRGTVAEWEHWTGRRFPRSGEYAVEQALVPVVIDRERDVGVYIEPNIWYFHERTAP